jgi:hypothetical protein
MSSKTGPRYLSIAIGVLLCSFGGLCLAAQPTATPEPPPRESATPGDEVKAVETTASRGVPAGYYPPPPPTGIYRAFSLTTAIGPGALIGPGEETLALSYNLFRVGFGVSRNVSFVFSFAGAGAPTINPGTNADAWLKQETWSLGGQVHMHQRFYARATMGLGFVSEKTANRKFDGGRGLAFSVAGGWELAQASRVALAVELNLNTTRYSREFWHMAGLHLALTVF